jgi:aldehyde:ferredoxin oxidoreductase
MAGYMGLWITGAAEHPIYMVINDDQVEIRDASRLWGLETYDTQNAIISEVEVTRPRVAVIGPAGENLLPFASILIDHGRVAARTGMGAIMGSKLLKAIVVKGSGKVPIANPEIYLPLRVESNRQMRDDPMSLVARTTGTAGVADYFDYLRSMPKKYYQLGAFEGVDRISGSTMTDTILKGVSACHACVIACGRVVSLDGIGTSGKTRKGPEYETVVGFGPNLLNKDLSSIVLLGELCDRLGVDTISVSNILGLAFLMYEKGFISKEQTGGRPLMWGDTKLVADLIREMVFREGIGALLATGARTFATTHGHPELAAEVKNLEVPYHDPRGVSGMALVYATSPRGACHNQSDYFFVDIGQFDTSIGLEVFDRQGGAEKAGNVAVHQNWRTVTNSLIMCLFANVPPSTILELLQSSDDAFSSVSLESVLKTGERGWNLKRVINNRLGLSSINDSLPAVFKKPFEDFPEGADGFVPDFEGMIAKYYQVRGWDPKTGYPFPEKLKELDLEWVIDDLRSSSLGPCSGG